MSAPTDKILNGSQRDNVKDSRPSPLPAFTSIRGNSGRRISHAESSASSSRLSDGRSNSHSPSEVREARTSMTSNGESSPIMNGSIRRKNRTSGSFLLEPTAQSSRLSRSILLRKDTKGKSRSHEFDQQALQRKSEFDLQDRSPSIGNSPLSTEVKQDDLDTEVESKVSSNARSRNHKNLILDSTHKSQTATPPSVGYDTDPAQIVEMALRLSEGRRRQASEKRYISGSGRDHRVISTASSMPPRDITPYSNVGEQQKLIQNDSPPKSLPVTPRKNRISDVSSPQPEPKIVSPEQDKDDFDEEIQISRATSKRVEKAKQYFELAYEHRRLISHLPPIRRPGSHHTPGRQGKDSKAYNPLQYARNRKLRFRERCPINTEVDGWNDVQKVRAWVDAVINSHTETRHDPVECVRLPPLSLREDEPQDSEDEQVKESQSSPDTQKTKPRRPRSDWVTNPGDLIADAYWLEQGLNKLKIYDRNNEAIYPPETQFTFSGWRNRPPLDVPASLQEEPAALKESPTTEKHKPSVSGLPNLPVFESAHKEHSWANRRSKFKQALAKGDRSTRKKGLGIFESSGNSSSGMSSTDEDNKTRRGRKRLTKQHGKFALPDGDPFAQAAEAAKADSDKELHRQSSELDRSPRGSKHGSIDHGNLFKQIGRANLIKSAARDETRRGRSPPKRNIFHHNHAHSDHEAQRSSFEYDSTAPSSPLVHAFPSIAINLSPAPSRSPSPTRKERNSLLHTVKEKMHTSKERNIVNEFMDTLTKPNSREPGASYTEKTDHYYKSESRDVSPTSRNPSPFTKRHSTVNDELSAKQDPQTAIANHRASTISKVSSRTTDSGTQRIKGMFKGGRIAEIVGTEVSKMGDFIWKREPPRSSFDSDGSSSGYESDSDGDVDDYAYKTSPREARNISSPQSPLVQNHDSPQSPVSRPTIREPQPQYFIPNLPSFTSPFVRDREEQERKKLPQSPGGTALTPEEQDHISRLAVEHRAASKSPRFDKLAPPRLNISGTSPSDELSRVSSYGFGAAMQRTQSASASFNNAISGRSSAVHTRNASPAFGRSLAISPDENSVSVKGGRVAPYDIARTRSLLVMTAVKAAYISRFADQVPDPQSKFLLDILPPSSNTKLWEALRPLKPNEQLHVKRREEHIFAARAHIAILKSRADAFNSRFDSFTSQTAQDLHRELQILEDKVEQELTPRVRLAADSAGELSQKLTTTSNMAVKAVNDQVAEAMRLRRRGPVRWVRNLGYALIEWGVVGMLWAIWFVVTVIRVVRATVGGTVKTLRWLLWID